MRVITPTGMTCEVSHMRGAQLREVRRLAQPGARKNDNFNPMTYILEQCVRVEGAGPYGGVKNFNDLLTGDRLYLYCKVREASLGTEYEFQVRCPACGKSFQWRLDLDDLDVISPPKEHVDAIAGGEGFLEEVDGYGQARIKYTTGHDELQMLSDLSKYDEWTATILAQVLSVGERTGRDAVQKLVDDEPIALMNALLALCRKYEFGYETVIEVQCTSDRCTRPVFPVRMPTDLGFFVRVPGRDFSG